MVRPGSLVRLANGTEDGAAPFMWGIVVDLTPYMFDRRGTKIIRFNATIFWSTGARAPGWVVVEGKTKFESGFIEVMES